VYFLRNVEDKAVVKWLKDNWQWAAVNVFALIIMLILWRQTNELGDSDSDFGPLLESGKWAARFLLLSLAMTPLNTLFGWRSAIKLRKPAGLWAFGFGASHFVFYIVEVGTKIWLQYPIPDYIAGLGVIALIVLSLMAATSTRWAMKRMGKWWKRLHRMVYVAGFIAIVHGLLEVSFSKRVLVYEPEAAYELRLYLLILVVLLAMRIPTFRASLASLRYRQGILSRKLE
jgi:sulfoxide reductase heme-binding subunit YedZ